MALPPQRLPPRGPRAPPAPQLLQAFVLPETFYPQGRDRPRPLQPEDAPGARSGGDRRPSLLSLPGAANLCQLPGQEQPFPAAWAPPVGVAPHAPQAPPAGMASLSAPAPAALGTFSIPDPRALPASPSVLAWGFSKPGRASLPSPG